MNFRKYMELAILVSAGFGLGAAFGLLVQGGAHWGTVGEWVGGIGAIFAALVALQFGMASSMREAEREQQRSAIATARISPSVQTFIVGVEMVKEMTLEAGPTDRLTRFLSAADLFEVASEAAELSKLRDEATHLPLDLAAAIEEILGSVRMLAKGLGVLQRVGPKGTPGRDKMLEACLSAIDKLMVDGRVFVQMCDRHAELSGHV